MKNKIIVFAAILCIISGSLSAQPIIPKVKNVIENFFHTYELKSQASVPAEFQKKTSGWWVVPLTIIKGNVVRSRPLLYFDVKRQIYLKLPLALNPKPSAVDYSAYVYSVDAYNFDLQPCYGYPGWYDDALRYFASLPALTNDQLFAKARAWSSKAISPISNQLADLRSGDGYKLGFEVNALKGKDLRSYTAAQDSAIVLFGELLKRDPHYPTIVGSMDIKYANEVMTKYHTLLCFAEEEAKKMVLPEHLYGDSILNMTRTLLESCPQNAILLSFGDNDLYPVLYMQAAMNLRRDVYCVNYNLLGIDKYIFRATQKQFDAEGIALDADTTMYAGTRNDILYINDSAAGMNWPMLRQVLAKGKQDENGLRTAAINRLYLPLKSDGSFGADGEISIEGANYFYKNQWVLLGMIGSLRKGRLLCSHYPFSDEIKGLNRFLKESGSVYIWGQ